MKYKFVTCFNEAYLKEMSSHLLSLMSKTWQSSIDIHCYYYDIDIKKHVLPEADNIFYHNLEEVEDYAECMENNKIHDGTEGGKVQYNRSIDAATFIPKFNASFTSLSLVSLLLNVKV